MVAYVAGFLTLFLEKYSDPVYFRPILESVLPEENIRNLVLFFICC